MGNQQLQTIGQDYIHLAKKLWIQFCMICLFTIVFSIVYDLLFPEAIVRNIWNISWLESLTDEDIVAIFVNGSIVSFAVTAFHLASRKTLHSTYVLLTQILVPWILISTSVLLALYFPLNPYIIRECIIVISILLGFSIICGWITLWSVYKGIQPRTVFLIITLVVIAIACLGFLSLGPILPLAIMHLFSFVVLYYISVRRSLLILVSPIGILTIIGIVYLASINGFHV